VIPHVVDIGWIPCRRLGGRLTYDSPPEFPSRAVSSRWTSVLPEKVEVQKAGSASTLDPANTAIAPEQIVPFIVPQSVQKSKVYGSSFEG
jgi:hypothetical protein